MGTVYHQGTKLLLAACLCMQLAACGAWAETSGHISQQALINHIEAGTAPLILDVRTVEEYDAGHIPGAINIHFQELAQRLDELNLADNQSIVVYCERGVRANIAEQTLQGAGIGTILHLEGDMALWRQNDLPVQQNQNSRGAANQQSLAPAADTPATTNAALEENWLVSATEAKQLIDQGATLLDTRKIALTRLQGSTYVDWQQFSPGDPSRRGNLLDDEAALTQKLRTLGISQQKPVVVFANPPGGWGEDGRIVWMLRTLGHAQAVMVDGGFEALVDAGVATQRGQKTTPPGDFVIRRNNTWEIEKGELKQQLERDNVVVIDTREEREFAGKTPYGEKRGGHVPGAVHLYFKEFLAADGTLLPAETIEEKLKSVGITRDTQVVVYCTGGIRSGWMAAVLATMDYAVKNYAGSMWEWSAGAEVDFPLETL